MNVVDLMRLEPDTEHPHGLPDREFETLFTPDRPVIFAYHGYPLLIHRLTYRRMNHDNLHVRGYKEEGTTTTPFDMVMLNDLDRFRLVIDVLDRVPGFEPRTARLARRWSTPGSMPAATGGSTVRTRGRSPNGSGTWRPTPSRWLRCCSLRRQYRPSSDLGAAPIDQRVSRPLGTVTKRTAECPPSSSPALPVPFHPSWRSASPHRRPKTHAAGRTRGPTMASRSALLRIVGCDDPSPHGELCGRRCPACRLPMGPHPAPAPAHARPGRRPPAPHR